jgi:hypothetical protein
MGTAPAGMQHRHRHHVVQPLELAIEDRSMRPRAGIGDIEAIAAGLGAVAGGAVRRHPMAKPAAMPGEFGLELGRLLDQWMPDASDQGFDLGHEMLFRRRRPG